MSIRSVEEGEPVRLRLPVLPLKATQIEAPPVDPWRSPRLEAFYSKSFSTKCFRYLNGRSITRSPGGDLGVEAEVNPAPQEGPRSKDH